MKTLVFFSGISPVGHYHQSCYIGSDLAVCFDALTVLVMEGWHLEAVKVFDQDQPAILVPIDAFDGKPFSPVLAELEREWQHLLSIQAM